MQGWGRERVTQKPRGQEGRRAGTAFVPLLGGEGANAGAGSLAVLTELAFRSTTHYCLCTCYRRRLHLFTGLTAMQHVDERVNAAAPTAAIAPPGHLLRPLPVTAAVHRRCLEFSFQSATSPAE